MVNDQNTQLANPYTFSSQFVASALKSIPECLKEWHDMVTGVIHCVDIPLLPCQMSTPHEAAFSNDTQDAKEQRL